MSMAGRALAPDAAAWSPEMVGERLEVLRDRSEMELVAYAAQAARAQTFEAVGPLAGC